MRSIQRSRSSNLRPGEGSHIYPYERLTISCERVRIGHVGVHQFKTLANLARATDAKLRTLAARNFISVTANALRLIP